MAGARVEDIALDGLTVRQRRWDSQSSRSDPAPPILLVHGLGANTASWLPVGQALADRRGVSVVAVDLVGFGYTRAESTTATLARNAALVISVLERIGPAVVAGNSMGGAITVKSAAVRPDLVEAMVLVNPALRPAGRRSPQWRNTAVMAPLVVPAVGARLIARRARQLGPEGLVDGTLQMVLEDASRLDPAVRDELVVAAVHRMAYPEAARAYADAASSLFRYLARRLDRDLAVALRTCPGLVVHGNRDRLIDVTSARAIAARHPAVDLLELDGIGHAPQLEAPDLFVDVVDRWLESVSRSSRDF